MDEETRILEQNDDLQSLVRRAMQIERSGNNALSLWTRAFCLDPNSSIIRQSYIRAGGFYAEPVHDEYLGSAFALTNLSVNGEKWNLIYGRDLIKDKKGRMIKKTEEEHLSYSIAGHQENPGGVAITSTLIDSSIKRAFYEHKNHDFLASQIEQFQKDELKKEQDWRLAGNVIYEGEQAIIEDIALDRTRKIIRTHIPQFNYNYLTLAPEQPLDRLGTTAFLPDNAIQFLTCLFGEEPALALPSIQYFTSRRNSNLAEVSIWTTSFDFRYDPSQRALAFVKSPANGRLYFSCYDMFDTWPACGWRSARKSHQ